jgi:hypothetical protein
MEPPRCRVCHRLLARHWRCIGCGALGHQIPRGSGRYCQWCEKERRKFRNVLWGRRTG